MYDGRVGRWMTIDPEEEFWSPYAAMGNNPVNKIDPDGAMTEDPPTLEAAIIAGNQSDLFQKLLDVNGINLDNYRNFITVGNRSKINPETRMIQIKAGTIEEMVIGLTHELTNKMYLGHITNALNEVRGGDISPHEYALKILEIEAFGITNQIVVSADLNIPSKTAQVAVDMVKTSKIQRGGVLKLVKNVMMNATTTTGKKNAYQLYKARGQFEREKVIKNGNKVP